jgi:hypothetical protein
MLNFKSEILDIPDSYRNSVPCQVQPELYTTKDLDLELDDETNADPILRKQRIAAKAAAEKKAVNACLSCVMINECREWALNTDVFGVAGGLTQRERNKLKRRNQVEQLSSSVVLNISVPSKAKKSINFDQVSKETLAIYEILSDGKQHTRDSVIDEAKNSVPKKMALQFAKTKANSTREKIDNGCRRLLLNRIDIGVRRGRILSYKNDEDIMLTLNPEVSREYHDWAAKQ